jgi:hypothetical protein
MKEHFREYSELYERINELDLKKYELENSMLGITGIAYDRIPSQPSGRDLLADKITELDELKAEISDLQAKKAVLYEKHLKEISKLQSEKHRKALRCYYLLKMDIPSIERAMNCTRTHFYKIKKQAENEFKILNDTH